MIVELVLEDDNSDEEEETDEKYFNDSQNFGKDELKSLGNEAND